MPEENPDTRPGEIPDARPRAKLQPPLPAVHPGRTTVVGVKSGRGAASSWFPEGGQVGSAGRLDDWAIDPRQLAAVERSVSGPRKRRLQDHDELVRELQARIWGAVASRRWEPPPLDALAVRIFTLAGAARPSTNHLCELLEGQPELGEALRVAAFGPSEGGRRRGGVGDAVQLLGLERARNLVLACALRQALYVGTPRYVLDELWHGAMGTAVAASMICQIRGRKAEKAFMLGLVHDVGRAALVPLCDRLLDKLGHAGALESAGPAVVHLLHARVGALILRRWGLPAEIIAATAYHHEREPPARQRNAVAVLRLASLVHQRITVGGESLQGGGDLLDHELVRTLGLDRERLAPVRALQPGGRASLEAIPGLD